ncbi:proline/betaine transporter [Burkholderia pseudomallei MSHR6137]|nr:proline/betaine transporter [Burkholderia pseudomallei MSHR6137]
MRETRVENAARRPRQTARSYPTRRPPNRRMTGNLHDPPSSCYYVASFNSLRLSFISVTRPFGRVPRLVARNFAHRKARLRAAFFVSTPLKGIQPAAYATRCAGSPTVPMRRSFLTSASARRPSEPRRSVSVMD